MRRLTAERLARLEQGRIARGGIVWHPRILRRRLELLRAERARLEAEIAAAEAAGRLTHELVMEAIAMHCGRGLAVEMERIELALLPAAERDRRALEGRADAARFAAMSRAELDAFIAEALAEDRRLI